MYVFECKNIFNLNIFVNSITAVKFYENYGQKIYKSL